MKTNLGDEEFRAKCASIDKHLPATLDVARRKWKSMTAPASVSTRQATLTLIR
jgi:hypothetical protein